MVYYVPRESFTKPPQSNDGHRPPFKTSLGESIDIIFSNSWPYKSITPFQVYLLGVFGCLSIFIAYISVSHYIYNISRHRRRRLRAAAKRGGVSRQKRMTEKKWRLRIEKDHRVEECHRLNVINLQAMDKMEHAVSNDSIDSYETPKRGAHNQTAFTHIHRHLHRADSNKQEKHVHTFLNANEFSYKLKQHVNSFPSETDRNERALEGNQCNIISGTMCLSQSEIEVQKEENGATECDASRIIDYQPYGAGANSKDDEHRLPAKNQCDDLTSDDTSLEVDDRSDAAIDVEHLMNRLISPTPVRLGHSTHLKETLRISSDNDSKRGSVARPSAVHCTKHDAKIASSSKKASIIQPEERNVISSHSISSANLCLCHKTSASNGPMELISESSAANIAEKENVSNTLKLIVLLSTGVADYTQAADQMAILSLVNDLTSSYEVIDGMDPSQREKRNELFKISGIRGNYPQIFINEMGHYRYLGGHDWLKGQSIDKVNKVYARNQRKTPDTPIHEKIVWNSSESGSSSVKSMKGHFTLLVSNGVADYCQAAKQKLAMLLLRDFNIPYKTVDGMNPLQREKRNELFIISGIRGNYPQLFVFDESSGQHRYLGNSDWLELQTASVLRAILGETAVESDFTGHSVNLSREQEHHH